MDLRQYFRKIQELESRIDAPYPVVVSLETADGGKPGLVSEVTRAQAAKLVVEGRAVLADEDTEAAFIARKIADKKAADTADAARRIQVALVSEADMSQLTTRKNKNER